ncbi:bifunctional hydroxymethylpyrimidine kinase/phosphomethylpyrimidine kinase [Edaphobacter albus]|uniref:bifunctional hydroxymethylpyrimidine kinase/phosphomethylpyrimidine kinase n=1 Tax=Edaphobacter sp. 4G125 TaxID=2763071 RepID=UPI001646460E|nr:bifunctional hydroxymethylpyrimidine kinase/phosphomethylpyrimidine kinase [Edaphobacter sp. 4G125]QNI35468.1 bifunctional hydroxymethylpyrimidine kinase/phosphomethylpyrimidine kinase [Edaphobacter sp. 4G125]
MQTVLSIAGFDPSSGAGITADLMVFAAHGLFGTSAITSLTVQSTLGVRNSQPVSPDLLRETLDCLHSDLPPAGVKLGMLATLEIVSVVADYLERLRSLSPVAPIVLDPVLRSSSGRELLSPGGLALLRERLLPLVNWVTPNLDELALLSGLKVTNQQEMVSAAQALAKNCPKLNIVATGGHLDQPDDLLLTAEGEQHWIVGERIDSNSTHGTGCAFSSALLSRLVRGEAPLEATKGAKEYVAEAIRRAVLLGYGKGPLNHLWPLR